MADPETDIALLKQQLAFEKEIRQAQATEYERRLGELNHAHAEAVRVQNTYVGEDVYDRDRREIISRLDKIERFDSEQQGRYAVVALVITVGLAMLTIVVNVFLRYVFDK